MKKKFKVPILLLLRLFLPLVPEKLELIMKNADLSTAQNSKKGVYILEAVLVNGKHYWSHVNGAKSIWWVAQPKQWCIGSTQYLGTPTSGLCFITDVPVPQEATNWKYSKNKQWVNTTDLDIGTYAF